MICKTDAHTVFIWHKTDAHLKHIIKITACFMNMCSASTDEIFCPSHDHLCGVSSNGSEFDCPRTNVFREITRTRRERQKWNSKETKQYSLKFSWDVASELGITKRDVLSSCGWRCIDVFSLFLFQESRSVSCVADLFYHLFQ